MFLEPYQRELSSNGPIVFMPNWQSSSPPHPLPPGHRSDVADEGRGEGILSKSKAPSPSSLPTGEGFEATEMPIPKSEIPGSTELAAGHPQSEKHGPLNPSRTGRPRALNDDKQATVCSLIAEGASLRQAARFVDCDPNSIRREARRNDEFRRRLAKARSQASIYPLQTLRLATRTNWRAALHWLERIDPQHFARPDASIVTKREANQFVADLVESIERAVSDSRERTSLFELLSAAMPAAMRRRWDSHGSRRNLRQAMREFEKKKNEAVAQRCERRREFTARIGSYLPVELLRELGDYDDVLDPDIIRADLSRVAAGRTAAPDQPQHDGPANDSLPSERPPDADPTSAGPNGPREPSPAQ